jgi:hypothetical protein
MPYIKNIKKDIYFKFKGKLLYNPTSNNLVGVDSRPVHYLEATELIEALYWSDDSNSIDRGYFRDPVLNFYVKNIDNKSDAEVEGEFWKVAARSPFGYTTMESYQEYVREVFNTVYQSKLTTQFQALYEEGKVIAATTEDLSYAEVTITHTISELTRATRDEFYVPSCTVEGLPKI